MKSSSNNKQRLSRLTDIYQLLNDATQQSLLDYAEFLYADKSRRAKQQADAEDIPDEPLSIPRPDQETVIAAIKRLSKTYPMLDSEKILHQTAHYMTQHIIHGQDAIEVIDELEVFFQQSFDSHKQEN